jgi:hypothetical protein
MVLVRLLLFGSLTSTMASSFVGHREHQTSPSCLQPNEIEQELEPEVKHPTPGVADLLAADRF